MSIISLLILFLLFFIFSLGLGLKNIFNIFSALFKVLKKDTVNLNEDIIDFEKQIPEKNNSNPYKQQSFIFQKRDLKSSDEYKLPSINLLAKKSNLLSKGTDLKLPSSDFIEKILLDFGIKGKIKKVSNGPVVSLYEFEPAPGIKVSKIVNLSDDIARNTSSVSARVSPIPGKNTVGIEIPNPKREGVVLSEIISSEGFQKKDIKLPITLGKNISGVPLVADLASMPHLLVAGTTGSGKSVAIHSMIMSLLYKSKPSDLQLLLVDPKMLELSVYDGIPHLLNPVITDMKQAVNGLRWCVQQMEKRFLKIQSIIKITQRIYFKIKFFNS